MYYSCGDDGITTIGIRADDPRAESTRCTECEELENAQERLENRFRTLSQKREASEIKLQQQISGIGVKMQEQFSDINTKLDHITKTLEAMQLHLQIRNKGKEPPKEELGSGESYLAASGAVSMEQQESIIGESCFSPASEEISNPRLLEQGNPIILYWGKNQINDEIYIPKSIGSLENTTTIKSSSSIEEVVNNLEDAHELIDRAVSTTLKESKTVRPKLRDAKACKTLVKLVAAGGYAITIKPSRKGLIPFISLDEVRILFPSYEFFGDEYWPPPAILPFLPYDFPGLILDYLDDFAIAVVDEEMIFVSSNELKEVKVTIKINKLRNIGSLGSRKSNDIYTHDLCKFILLLKSRYVVEPKYGDAMFSRFLWISYLEPTTIEEVILLNELILFGKIEKNLKLFQFLTKMAELASAKTMVIVSRDLKEFFNSDTDEIPNSLQQFSKIDRSKEFLDSVACVCQSKTCGILRGYKMENSPNEIQELGSSIFYDRLLDKMITLIRVQYLYMTKLADQTRHYEEMVQFMDNLILTGVGTKLFLDNSINVLELHLRISEMLAATCSGANAMEELWMSSQTTLGKKNYLHFVHNIYELQDVVRNVVSWEAIVTIVSLEGREFSAEKIQESNEKLKVKAGLKISCVEALWMLAKGSVSIMEITVAVNRAGGDKFVYAEIVVTILGIIMKEDAAKDLETDPIIKSVKLLIDQVDRKLVEHVEIPYMSVLVPPLNCKWYELGRRWWLDVEDQFRCLAMCDSLR